MLGRRVVTALVLLAILLPAIFVYPPLAWGVLTLVFLTVGAWEWGRLLEPPGASSMHTRWSAEATRSRPGVTATGPLPETAWASSCRRQRSPPS